MTTIYLVDLENVGTKQLRQHVEHHQDAEYIIFYSDSTSKPCSILEQIPETIYVVFVDCKTGGDNAMDFCICATAGKLSVSRIQKIRILTNDKGYDSMIRMLQEQGVRITREGVTYPMKQESVYTEDIPIEDITYPTKQESVYIEDIDIDEQVIAVIRKHVPKQYQEKLIKTFSKISNRKEAYEACQAILPQKIAIDVYKKIKKCIPKE